MTPTLRSMIAGALIGFALGLAAFALGMSIGVPNTPCVPDSAIQYDGQLNAWLDADHVVVMMADQEDDYQWCSTLGRP